MREVWRLASPRETNSAASPGNTIDQFVVPRGNLDKLQISAQNQLWNAHFLFLQEMEEETRAALKRKREDESSSPGPPPFAQRTPEEASPLLTLRALETGRVKAGTAVPPAAGGASVPPLSAPSRTVQTHCAPMRSASFSCPAASCPAPSSPSPAPPRHRRMHLRRRQPGPAPPPGPAAAQTGHRPRRAPARPPPAGPAGAA